MKESPMQSLLRLVQDPKFKAPGEDRVLQRICDSYLECSFDFHIEDRPAWIGAYTRDGKLRGRHGHS